jgi:hypothetical protein
MNGSADWSQQQNVAQAPAVHTMHPPTASKPRTNWLLIFIFLILGLIIGGAGGYLSANYLVYGPRLDASETEKAQLESRVAALENELTQLKQGGTNPSTTPTTSTGGTTTGTGTGSTASGITPSPVTATWSTYTNAAQHFSFKYPADYTVKEMPIEDEARGLLTLGIFRAGDTEPAGWVLVYKSQADGGPDHRELKLSAFVNELPTSVQTEPAGAGQVSKVSESNVVLNGTQAIELKASEGKGLEATPSGETFTGYLVEETFDANYLIGGCSTDVSSPMGLVGCPFETTFTILR